MGDASKELTPGPEMISYSVEWDGYCKHGVYVGGCGIDWMCPECESDE